MSKPTKDDLREGLRPSILKKLKHVAAVLDRAGGAIPWSQMAGRGGFEVITSVRGELVVNEEIREKTLVRLAGLLGECRTKLLTTTAEDETTYTGEVAIKVIELSDKGAERLARGFWTTLSVGEDGGEEPRGFFVHRDTVLDTLDLPSFATEGNEEHYREVWWDHHQEHCPSKGAVYEALEREITRAMEKAKGPPLSVADGSVVAAGGEGTAGKHEYGAGWLRGQRAGFIHAVYPPFGITEKGGVPSELSHGIERRDATKIAKKDPGAYKIRVPREFIKELHEGVDQAEGALGITLNVKPHGFPNFNLRDARESYKLGKPVRGKKMPSGALVFEDDQTRAVIRAVSAARSTELGITDPVEMGIHLRLKCGVTSVAIFYQEELKEMTETPAATVYSFWCLVDKGDSTTMRKVANPVLAWTDALTMRMWARGDSLNVKDSELYIAQGELSVVKETVKAAEQTTSVVGIFSNITEEAKVMAGRQGISDSGYQDRLARKMRMLAELTGRNDEHELDLRLEREQQRQLERERREEERMCEREEKAEARGDAPSPKRERAEITVRINTQRGEPLELPVEIGDVPTEGGKPSLNDLAKFLWDQDAFGESAGIDPFTLEDRFEYAGEPLGTNINFVVAYKRGQEGSTWGHWEVVVGKDAGTSLRMLDTMKEGVLTITPMATLRKLPQWAGWMTTVLEPYNPSPLKVRRGAPPGVTVCRKRLRRTRSGLGTECRLGACLTSWVTKAPARWMRRSQALRARLTSPPAMTRSRGTLWPSSSWRGTRRSPRPPTVSGLRWRPSARASLPIRRPWGSWLRWALRRMNSRLSLWRVSKERGTEARARGTKPLPTMWDRGPEHSEAVTQLVVIKVMNKLRRVCLNENPSPWREGGVDKGHTMEAGGDPTTPAWRKLEGTYSQKEMERTYSKVWAQVEPGRAVRDELGPQRWVGVGDQKGATAEAASQVIQNGVC